MRERAGSGAMALDVADGTTVDGAVGAVMRELEGDRLLPPRLMRAVNGEYVDGDAVLGEGDELALIPPVSGGAEGAFSGPLAGVADGRVWDREPTASGLRVERT